MPKNEVKAGWRCSEFWLALIAELVGALAVSGIFAVDSTTAKIVGGVIMVLAALGYTVSRTRLKSNGFGL